MYVEKYVTKYYQCTRFEPLNIKMPSYHKLTIITNGNGQLITGISYLPNLLNPDTIGKTEIWYKEGTEIFFKAIPSYGYLFESCSITESGKTNKIDTDFDKSFIMQKSDITLTANFTKSDKPDISYKDGILKSFSGTGDLIIADTSKKSDTDACIVPTTSIDYSAFEPNNAYCNPKTITIPESINNIPDGVFQYCYNLEAIIINESNKNYSSMDGVLFNYDKTILIAYPAKKKDKKYVIPDTVVEIASNAFANNANLENIQFSKNLDSICYGAFENAQSINEIRLPESVYAVGTAAFKNNFNLKKGISEFKSK